MTMHRFLLAAALLLLAPATARAEEFYGRYVPSADTARPRLKFNDSLVSLNNHCPVTTSRLNRKIQPLYINGEAIGFC